MVESAVRAVRGSVKSAAASHPGASVWVWTKADTQTAIENLREHLGGIEIGKNPLWGRKKNVLGELRERRRRPTRRRRRRREIESEKKTMGDEQGSVTAKPTGLKRWQCTYTSDRTWACGYELVREILRHVKGEIGKGGAEIRVKVVVEDGDGSWVVEALKREVPGEVRVEVESLAGSGCKWAGRGGLNGKLKLEVRVGDAVTGDEARFGLWIAEPVVATQPAPADPEGTKYVHFVATSDLYAGDGSDAVQIDAVKDQPIGFVLESRSGVWTGFVYDSRGDIERDGSLLRKVVKDHEFRGLAVTVISHEIRFRITRFSVTQPRLYEGVGHELGTLYSMLAFWQDGEKKLSRVKAKQTTRKYDYADKRTLVHVDVKDGEVLGDLVLDLQIGAFTGYTPVPTSSE